MQQFEPFNNADLDCTCSSILKKSQPNHLREQRFEKINILLLSDKSWREKVCHNLVFFPSFFVNVNISSKWSFSLFYLFRLFGYMCF